MSNKLKFDDYIVTSIEEQEFIRADYRKALRIIVLSLISAGFFTFLFYIS